MRKALPEGVCTSGQETKRMVQGLLLIREITGRFLSQVTGHNQKAQSKLAM